MIVIEELVQPQIGRLTRQTAQTTARARPINRSLFTSVLGVIFAVNADE